MNFFDTNIGRWNHFDNQQFTQSALSTLDRSIVPMEPNNNTSQSKYDYRDYPPMNSGFGSEFEKSTPSQSFHHQNNDSIQRYNNGGGFAEPIRPFPFIAEQFPPTEYRANGPSFI